MCPNIITDKPLTTVGDLRDELSLYEDNEIVWVNVSEQGEEINFSIRRPTVVEYQLKLGTKGGF